MKYLLILVVLIVAAGGYVILRPGFGSYERWFAPKAELWDRWLAHDPEGATRPDHRDWSAFLSRNLAAGEGGVNLVDYGAVSAGDRELLGAYIQRLTALAPALMTRGEQLAYWINLYNALTVQVVLDHYPVKSIRDIRISPGLLGIGPWDKTLIEVDGAPLSLNDIEHRILRPIWDDPRIHYAVNCASIGCPNLALKAYDAKEIDVMLDAAARAYVNDPRGVSITDGAVSVSRIYDWFIADFGASEEAVLAHLLQYAEPDLAEKLRAIGRIGGQHYDWRLNDARR